MSAIPPNWLSSIIGAHGAQDRSAIRKNKETADQAERTDNVNFKENLQNVIDNSDRDGEVYEDAEGLGSQGRSSEEAPPDQPQDEQRETDQSSGGLDVQA